MKSTDAEILVIAGYEGSGDTHWQRRLLSKLSAAKLVEQDDWLFGSLAKAVNRLVVAVSNAQKPVVFVAHSLGCSLVAHSIKTLAAAGEIQKVKGAFLVAAPSSQTLSELHGIDPQFADVPRDPFPFPSILVASSNDPLSTLEDSADIASAWGSQLVEAGEAGHINTESGHGPWPEGMMRFAGFISKLQA